MNDGIYYPFSEERFEKYQDGMRFLRERAAAAGAKVLHLTPPVFDPVPIRSKTLPAGLAEYRQPYEGYDEVLDRYSAWLLARKADGWDVVDVHGPMKRFLAARRDATRASGSPTTASTSTPTGTGSSPARSSDTGASGSRGPRGGRRREGPGRPPARARPSSSWSSRSSGCSRTPG